MAKQTGRRKPSRKKTLQEVTSTLQDLINNELSDASLRIKSIQSKVEQVKQKQLPGHTSGSRTTAAGAAEAANDRDDENWIEALGDELEEFLPTQQSSGANEQPHAGTAIPENPVQQPPATKSESGQQAEAGSGNNRFNDQIDMWDDDIPVLREVAALSPAAKRDTKDSGATPARERARKLAVKIIARLNIELREKGKPELEPLIINRLQRILEEELAQQATNVENSGHE